MFRNQLIVDAIIIGTILIFLRFFSLTYIEDTSKLNSIGIVGLGTLLALISFYALTFKKGIEKNTLDKYVLLLIASLIIKS